MTNGAEVSFRFAASYSAVEKVGTKLTHFQIVIVIQLVQIQKRVGFTATSDLDHIGPGQKPLLLDLKSGLLDYHKHVLKKTFSSLG